MSAISSGDLALKFALRRQMSVLKADIQARSTEMTTGKTADVAATVSGEFSALAGLERSLRTITALRSSTNEATILSDTMQLSLNTVGDAVARTVQNLLRASSLPNSIELRTAAADAEQSFSIIVSALNVQTGGRTVFGGIQTEGAALASADTMITELKTLTANETTAAGIQSIVTAWFDDAGGGFEARGYLGDTVPLGDIQITSTARVRLDVSANNTAFRSTLKALAMGFLLNEGAVAGDLTVGGTLAQTAGLLLTEAQDDVISLRAEIGYAQESIETAVLSNSAEKASLEILRSNMLGVDPYDANTALEAAQTQLETLYAVTSRLSQLSLADFLR